MAATTADPAQGKSGARTFTGCVPSNTLITAATRGGDPTWSVAIRQAAARFFMVANGREARPSTKDEDREHGRRRPGSPRMTTAQRRRSEPKGKPTPARNERRPDVDKANRQATLQWILVFAVVAILLIGVAFLGPSGDGVAPIRRHGG